MVCIRNKFDCNQDICDLALRSLGEIQCKSMCKPCSKNVIEMIDLSDCLFRNQVVSPYDMNGTL